MRHELRKALPRVLSPENDGGSAGLILDEPTRREGEEDVGECSCSANEAGRDKGESGGMERE